MCFSEGPWKLKQLIPVLTVHGAFTVASNHILGGVIALRTTGVSYEVPLSRIINWVVS